MRSFVASGFANSRHRPFVHIRSLDSERVRRAHKPTHVKYLWNARCSNAPFFYLRFFHGK